MPEPVRPISDGFVADIDTPLMQETFDVAKGQRKSDIHHDGKLDDFGRGLEISEGRSDHPGTLECEGRELKPSSADTAVKVASHRN